MKTVKLGVLGLGIVGSEFVSLVNKNAKRIASETGYKLEIESVFVRDTMKTRDTSTTGLQLTTNAMDIVNNPAIDIICECMGGNGFETTRELVLQSLKNGKHVIMSSKKALARNAEELLHCAYSHQRYLKYDASVGGGIPIAKVLEKSFRGDSIVKIAGVFNATSNFIYSSMFADNQSYETALKNAQDKGYAENDPSDDVDGIDSLNKLIILTMFGMHKIVKHSGIKAESFKGINTLDMKYAGELGYTIKPLALIKTDNDLLEYKIGPCLVPSSHIIANTHNNFNAILVEGESCGELGFYGQGAGAKPTATAMFDDLVNILENASVKITNGYDVVCESKVKELESGYYWRFKAKNEVGVFTKISNIFTRKNVTIDKIIQKPIGKDISEIVLITGSNESNKIVEVRKLLQKESIIVEAMLSCI